MAVGDDLAVPVQGREATNDREAGWRLSFERNPLPMWVFDVETLRFLAVNEAAVRQYGWSHASRRSQCRRAGAARPRHGRSPAWASCPSPSPRSH